MHFNHFVAGPAALATPFGVGAAPPFTLPKKGTSVKTTHPDGDGDLSVDLGPRPALLKNTTGLGNVAGNLGPVVNITLHDPRRRINQRGSGQARNKTKEHDDGGISMGFAGGVAGSVAGGAGGGMVGGGAGILFGLAKPKMRGGKSGKGRKGRKGSKASKTPEQS